MLIIHSDRLDKVNSLDELEPRVRHYVESIVRLFCAEGLRSYQYTTERAKQLVMGCALGSQLPKIIDAYEPIVLDLLKQWEPVSCPKLDKSNTGQLVLF